MAEIVGGFCVPHNPLTTSEPNAAPADKAKRVLDAYANVKRRIEKLQADIAIIIGDDHYAMFHPKCQPRLLIGTGELEGPLEPEPWLKITRRSVPNAPDFASHLMRFGFDSGFDWAVSKSLVLDHSVMVPIHFCIPSGVKVLPIYISSGMEPIIPAKRCAQLGAMIAQGVCSWNGSERIVVIGTGGVSHWVGMVNYGSVNENFDRAIMANVGAGKIEALMELTDEEIIQKGGNGALEIRNWIVAMAALRGGRAEVIEYVPIPEWVCGYGFVELSATA